MTKEQISLLLQDLCARLPYSVKVESVFINIDTKEHKSCGIEVFNATNLLMIRDGLGEFKPYLFPLSSMTEKQQKELQLEHEKDVKTMANCLKKCSEGDTSLRGKNILYHAVDWCNKNHFDYRGLIPMELALDATGLNIY